MQDYSFFLKSHDLNVIKSSSFLITGGAGFIGSNIVEWLLQNGAKKVRILDNLSNGFFENISRFTGLESFEFIEGDIRDLDVCLSACRGMDYVSHQAALGSVPRSINDPITTNSVNIGGHLNILYSCKENGVKRMVYAASSSTYGSSQELPKREDVIGKPLSPYAVTKYVNELYAEVFSNTYQFKTIGLRYFNVFGPRQSPQGAYAAVIPLFFDSLINGRSPFINGDGEQTRDFTYVENAVQANILAMLSTKEQAVNQVYNIAVGERISLNELFRIIKSLCGNHSINPIYRDSRIGDIRNSLADITKAQTLLGYNPTVSVKEGLELTYKYWNER